MKLPQPISTDGYGPFANYTRYTSPSDQACLVRLVFVPATGSVACIFSSTL